MNQKHSTSSVKWFTALAMGATAVVAVQANANIIGMEVLSVSGDPNFDPATDATFNPNFHQGLAGMGLTHVISTLNNNGAWIELEIKITRSAGSIGEEMVATDIDITNNTNQHWASMHFEIGMGLGNNFGEFNGLAFKGLTSAFPPNELLGRFPNITQNKPTMPTQIWFEGPPGMAPGDVADFWLAWKIPESKFVNDMATITFRQHIPPPVPAPGTLALIALTGCVGIQRRRR